jgi:hypothetical protein
MRGDDTLEVDLRALRREEIAEHRPQLLVLGNLCQQQIDHLVADDEIIRAGDLR